MTPLAAEILAHLRTERGALTLSELEADAKVQQGGGRWPEGSVREAVDELVAYGRVFSSDGAISFVPERPAVSQGNLFDD